MTLPYILKRTELYASLLFASVCLKSSSMSAQPWQFTKDRRLLLFLFFILGSYNHIFCPINVKKD